MKAILVCCIFLIGSMNQGICQNFKSGVYDRIDSITVTDLETGLTESKIVKVNAIYLDASNCESLPAKFIAQDCSADEVLIKQLTEIEFRCNGMFQRNWEGEWNILSFNLVVYKDKHPPMTVFNQGSEFSKKTMRLLSTMKSGEHLKFARIILDHPQKGRVIAGFSLLVN